MMAAPLEITCRGCKKTKPNYAFPGRLHYCEMCRNPSKKTCKECRQEKPIDEFGKGERMMDGHNNYCKKCRYARVRITSLAYYRRNRARCNELSLRWYRRRKEDGLNEMHNRRIDWENIFLYHFESCMPKSFGAVVSIFNPTSPFPGAVQCTGVSWYNIQDAKRYIYGRLGIDPLEIDWGIIIARILHRLIERKLHELRKQTSNQ
jgi:hypothetical protein